MAKKPNAANASKPSSNTKPTRQRRKPASSSSAEGKADNQSTNNSEGATSSESNASSNSGGDSAVQISSAVADIIAQSTKMNFSTFTGLSYSLGNQMDYTKKFQAPGIAAITLRHSFGNSTSASSALNVMSQKYFNDLRAKSINTSKEFDAPDLTLYFLAVAEAYSFINYLTRSYGLYNFYHLQNKYFPDRVLEATGIPVHIILQEPSNFVAFINSLIHKLEPFKVPGDMLYFDEVAKRYAYIYMESEAMTDQMYVFRPAGFYVFEHAEEDDYAGRLTFKALPSFSTFDDIKAYASTIIEPLSELYSQDMAMYSALVTRVYEGNVKTMSYVPESFMTQPVLDALVLWQIKNATVMPASQLVTPEVKQDKTKGYLVSNVQVTTSMYVTPLLYDRVIDSFSNDLGAAGILSLTRFTVGAIPSETAGTLEIHAGLEFIEKIDIYYTDEVLTGLCYASVASASTVEGLYAYLKKVAAAKNFKWFPMIQHFQAESSTKLLDSVTIFDTDTPAIVRNADIKQYHQNRILNVFSSHVSK